MATAKFNETGTHIQHGFLKIRIDLYPDVSSKTHKLHYVDKPIIPESGIPKRLTDEEFQAWLEGLPTEKELNPCLCHFIKIDTTATRPALEAEIKGTFDKPTFRQLDDLLSDIDKPEKRLRLGQLMKPKAGRGKVIPYSTDAKKLVKKVNTRFGGLEVEVG